MKKNNILKFTIFSGIFVMILGTLLHFTYEWSGNNKFIASFSAVNESTWEHLKLLFFPMLLTTIIGYFYLRKISPNFLCARLLGILTAILFTITFFYTYTGIIGTNFSFIDISIFFAAVILGELVSYKILLSDFKCNNYTALFFIILLLVCFVSFTYFPPKIGLFKDPISGLYGIIEQKRTLITLALLKHCKVRIFIRMQNLL